MYQLSFRVSLSPVLITAITEIHAQMNRIKRTGDIMTPLI